MRKKENHNRSPLLLPELAHWAGILMAVLLILSLGSGPLLRDGSPSHNGMFVALLLTIATARYYWRFHFKTTAANNLATALDGPLLLIIVSWSLYRFGQSFIPNLIVVPAMTLAWVTIRHRGLITLLCVLTALVIEAGLAVTGNQPLALAMANILVCLTVSLGLNFFPGSRMYKTKLRQEQKNIGRDRAAREQAAEMGLAADNISTPEMLQTSAKSDNNDSFRQQTIESINKSFELQLEMIRVSLDLTTIAVLWPSQTNDTLRLRYLATTRKDIDAGPYPPGTGITGALASRDEAEMVGVKPSHPALPYYQKKGGVGGVMALRIPTNTGQAGILCADRQTDQPWSERQRQVLRLTSKKLGLEIQNSRLLLNMDRELATIHRLYNGLRELSSDPNLEAIFATSIKTVKAQVPADLLALCLTEGSHYQVMMAEGDDAASLADHSFPVTGGLVGQAIKTAKTVPAGGRYLGAAPIFCNDRTYLEFRSLLVIPLPDEDNTPIGCLVVASRTPNVFTKNRQEILEIIAGQIAIKVKLGQAHEQLALLATTDGLTGLANHRSFQHGFDVMLARAKRNSRPLCVLLADLDHFKGINDNFGHPFGDQILQQVARVMLETVRTFDLAARYGGEEFALVLENCDAETGLGLAERIRGAIAQLELACDDRPVKVTLSLGVSTFPANGGDKSRLIEMADQALYRAKRDGRNQTAVWSEASAEHD